MSILELLSSNLSSPLFLAFLLGIVATLIRSDLKVPDQLYTALSIYLLLALGLKGGAELHAATFAEIGPAILGTLGLSLLIPLLTIGIVHKIGKLSLADACALAAHYGSVSVVTFMAASNFLVAIAEPSESYLMTLVILMEVPAIILALGIAGRSPNPQGKRRPWGQVMHETLTGRSILLLVGGLVIGFVAGPPGLDRVAPLFVSPFQGVVMLFLLEMGMITAKRFPSLKRVGLFLVSFAILMPLFAATVGIYVGSLCDMTKGGAFILGTLAGSASYIAAPAAVRIALPEANPAYYLTCSLGITFPFNLSLGIPIYYQIAGWIYA
jgi:hypothetical protein